MALAGCSSPPHSVSSPRLRAAIGSSTHVARRFLCSSVPSERQIRPLPDAPAKTPGLSYDQGWARRRLALLVRDRMTAPAITVDPKTSIYDALTLMKEKRIRRFPVVKGRRLVGVVTWT